MPVAYNELRQRHVAALKAALPEHVQRLQWTPQQLRADREDRLRILVRTAIKGSRWHRERLGGIDPNTLSEDQLERLPTMTKADLMANWDDIVTDRRLTLDMVEEHLAGPTDGGYLLDQYRAVASSGSSGQRGVFVYDWEGWLVAGLVGLRSTVRLAAIAGETGPQVTAVVGAESPTHVTSAIARTFSNPALPVTPVPVTLPVLEIVSRLNSLQPLVLSGYPSMLHALTVEAQAGRLQIRPRRVLAAAEPLLPEARAAIRNVWGAPVRNGYGASECALVAAGCEDGGGHLVDDLICLEPVDALGSLVPAGTTSDKVLLTNLFNLALPLIRYEITDQVALVDGDCGCGCTHRRIGDVQGRLDDVFTYPGGIRVHPHVFRSPLSHAAAVTMYQVAQTSTGASVKVELAAAAVLDNLQRELEASLRRAGLLGAEVTVEAVEALPRGATGKLKRFVPLAATPASPPVKL